MYGVLGERALCARYALSVGAHLIRPRQESEDQPYEFFEHLRAV